MPLNDTRIEIQFTRLDLLLLLLHANASSGILYSFPGLYLLQVSSTCHFQADKQRYNTLSAHTHTHTHTTGPLPLLVAWLATDLYNLGSNLA